jgi:hypothetical protein
MDYKKLQSLDKTAGALKIIYIGMLVFLLLQIVRNYFKYNRQGVSANVNTVNIMQNSHLQINTNSNNLYIDSDTVIIRDGEIILKNNIINSDFGSGESGLMTYNRTTKDVSLEERPKFMLDLTRE